MFRYFNKILKTSRKAMSRKEGQVAVILILVVAAALIFYAASVNLSRVSQAKGWTTIAADTGASQLASYMASYGQQVFQTTLGGRTKICASTGGWLSVLVLIVAIVVVVVSGGTLAWVSVALAAAAVYINVAIIQPGLTDMWNNYIFTLMTPTDAFVEQGIQTSLLASVTDQAVVPDVTDFDQDRIFGLDINGDPLDRISRFGFYYQKRLDLVEPPLSAAGVEGFLAALRGFLYNNGDNWGIVDGFMDGSSNLLGPSCAPFNYSSECDPCCVEYPALRPADICGTPLEPANPLDPVNVNVRTKCEANSPYGLAYPWVYDPYRGYPANGFDSFQEQIGRDDEHQLFEKNPAAPNGAQASVLLPPPPLPPSNFKLKDATGFYTPAVYPPADNRTGVYPFFYKIADWKVNLNQPFDLTAKPNQCHWCDQREASVGACPPGQPLEIPQLVLDPGTPPSGAVYNTTLCVDGTNLVPGNPPLAVDRVRLPDAATGLIEAASAQCAQSADGTLTGRQIGFWKRGGDRFCSTIWPYYGSCPKEGSSPPPEGRICGGAGALSPENWPDDLLDSLEYGLNDFADWARWALAQRASSLAKNLDTWYPGAAPWIERGKGSGAVNSPTCTSPGCCYVCAEQDGALWVWYNEILEMKTRLEAWRDTSFAGAACTDVWCVPPVSAGCGGGRDSTVIGGSGPEANTFGTGTMRDVVNCLNWNAADAGGNAAKFQNCENACAASDYATANLWCGSLPRSLVPGFDGAYTPADLAYLACPGTCSTCYDGCPASCSASCSASCAGSPDPACIATCTAACTSTCQTACCASASCACAGGCGCDDVRTSGACYTAGLPAAQGSCLDPSFRARVQQSIPEAQNQVAKFRKRHAFLSGRLAEMDNLISVLAGAESKFLGFLTCEDADGDGQPDGLACRLIRDRINFDSTRKTGLPYQAVYGWQSEPQKGQPQGSGKWHIVRVDTRIPRRCDNACNAGQVRNGGDPAWPWVRTYTEGKWWNQSRCYELTSTTGAVKVRVSRYDETSTFATLLFPNAVEIWRPSFTRADRPAMASPDNIEAVCVSAPSMVPDLCSTPPCPLAPGSHYYGAFMLNERLDNVRDPACVIKCSLEPDPDAVAACKSACPLVGNLGCWDLAHNLLTQGVTSEACAVYYFSGGSGGGSGGGLWGFIRGITGGTGSGFDFKFVPCANF